MKLFKTETALAIFFTAIMTSIGTIIVSPISISLSFWLNDYLSRPILSIEYVELLPQYDNYKSLKIKVNDLIGERGYQEMILDGKINSINHLSKFAFSEQPTMIEVENLSSFLNELKHIKIEKTKNTNGSYFSENNSVSIENSKLSIENFTGAKDLTDDSSDVNKFIKKIDKIENLISNHNPNIIENFRIKLNILNRGNSDGLIKSVGNISINGTDFNARIVNISKPKKKTNTMAINVKLADEEEDKRSTSVGKIEKDSMVELWYELKDRSRYISDINKFFSSNDKVKMKVTLYNQSNEKFEFNTELINTAIMTEG